MNGDRDYSSIAFVSGKGGVGKTTIAANIAWIASTAPARVLLIDLDFQNLGCTGMFAARYELGKSNALALLRTDQAQDEMDLSLTQITENLQFLPAALITQPVEHRDTFLDIPRDLYRRLDRLLDRLNEVYDFDCFILDCHGGIDPTSAAAAGVCDYTLVVTEADTVTFAGTLGLIDSYYDCYGSANRQPKIEYIVNRIPPKYRWRDLDNLYRDYLGKHLGRFTESKSVLAYVPAEGYLAESFGDYPFQVELAPSSLFARKLGLMLYSLFDDSRQTLLSRKIRKRFGKKRYAKKTHQRLTSTEAKSVRTVFTLYGLIALGIPVASVVANILTPALSGAILDAQRVAFAVTVILAVPLGICFLISLFRVFLYFREKLKFQKAFFKVLGRDRTLWRRLSLWRLRAFYYGIIFLFIILFVGVLGNIAMIVPDTNGVRTTLDSSEDWREFSSYDGRFSVELPGTPTEKQQRINTLVGPVDVTVSMVEKRGITYVVTCRRSSQDFLANIPDVALDSAQDDLVALVQGKLLSELAISLDGYPGRELEIEGAGGDLILRTRLFLVGNTFYQVTAAIPREKVSSERANISRFLDSFALISPE